MVEALHSVLQNPCKHHHPQQVTCRLPRTVLWLQLLGVEEDADESGWWLAKIIGYRKGALRWFNGWRGGSRHSMASVCRAAVEGAKWTCPYATRRWRFSVRTLQADLGR